MSELTHEKNLPLFEKMAKRMIEGGFEKFREATGLLASWLSKRQAYYPGALFQIIRLLFIAQLRVRKEVNFDHGDALLFRAQRHSENPFAVAYIKLVNATLPFEDAFSDTEKGLREGYQQLIASVAKNLTEPQIPQRSPSPRPADSVESVDKLVPLPPPISEAIPSSQAPSVVLHSPTPKSFTLNDPVDLELSTPANPKGAVPTSSIPKQREKSRDSPASGSTENTLSVSITAGEQLTLPEPQPAPVSALCEQIGITALESGFDLPAEFTAHTTDRQPQPDENVDQSERNLPVPLISNRDAYIPGHDSSANSRQDLHTVSLAKESVEATDLTMVKTGQIPPLTYADQMDIDSVAVQLLDKPIGSGQVLTHSTDNAVANMEINAANQHEGLSRSEPNAMEVDGLESAKFTVLPNPKLEHAVNKIDDFPGPTESMSPPPSSGEMGIIARQQGLNGGFRVIVDFDITRGQFELIKKWSKRSGSPAELASGVCITLGCYLLADLKEKFETGRFSSFEQQVSATPCKWPEQRGCLSLKIISAESKEENLPLSPPFLVTPNNLLDISGLLAEGRNRLQLHQTTDLGHFLFVLHAHRPTRQQLEQEQGYMRKRKEWQQFLEDLAAPLSYDSLTSLVSVRA